MEIIRQFITRRIMSGIIICNYKQDIHYEFKNNCIKEYLNGALHGRHFRYRDDYRYISGKMQLVRVVCDENYYAHGLLHGECSSFGPDGYINHIFNYSYGLSDGQQTIYDRTGNAESTRNYKHSYLHGTSIYNKCLSSLLRKLIFQCCEAYEDDKLTKMMLDNGISRIPHGASCDRYWAISQYYHGLLHGAIFMIDAHGKVRKIFKLYYGKLAGEIVDQCAYW